MRNKQAFIYALGATLALLAGPWALAQTAGVPPAPAAPVTSPGATRAPTEPLNNQVNRNPVYRAQLPDYTPPPPDPRDSSTRPVQPPGSFDERDTVLRPGVPASAARSP
jgi:hypothetical protein